MCIKKFVRKHPVTILLFFFLIIVFTMILVDNKIYATDTKNTPGCSCSGIVLCGLTNFPNDSFLCNYDCTCRYGEIILVCGDAYKATCKGEVSSGCRGRECVSTDCDPKCESDPRYSSCPECRCEACKVYKVTQTCERVCLDGACSRFICEGSCVYKKVESF